MRDARQVQQAHDMLQAIVLGELPTPPGRRSRHLWGANRAAMIENLNALCWVPARAGSERVRGDEHKNVPTMAANLLALDAWLCEHGFVMMDQAGMPAPAFPVEPEE